MIVRIALGIFMLASLAACQTAPSTGPGEIAFRSGETTIALMPLDIELYELTAGGVLEPRADWTSTAHGHVASAIDAIQSERGLKLVKFDPDRLVADRQKVMAQVVKLHSVVGREILLQRHVPDAQPPSKQGRFDWGIGPNVGEVSAQTGADYGLFVFMQDSYSSAGRRAMSLVLALVGVSVQGGTQIGFASLVDLRTGQIVWFSSLARGVGNLKTAESARQAMDDLFRDLPEG